MNPGSSRIVTSSRDALAVVMSVAPINKSCTLAKTFAACLRLSIISALHCGNIQKSTPDLQ